MCEHLEHRLLLTSNVLDYTRADLELMESLKSQGADGLVPYYELQVDKGDKYGELALGVVTGKTASGAAARSFASNIASNLGVDTDGLDDSELEQLAVTLMIHNYESKKARFESGDRKLVLSWSEQLEDHRKGYRDRGLPIDGWTLFAPIGHSGLSENGKQELFQSIVDSSDTGILEDSGIGIGLTFRVVRDFEIERHFGDNLGYTEAQLAQGVWAEAFLIGGAHGGSSAWLSGLSTWYVAKREGFLDQIYGETKRLEPLDVIWVPEAPPVAADPGANGLAIGEYATDSSTTLTQGTLPDGSQFLFERSEKGNYRIVTGDSSEQSGSFVVNSEKDIFVRSESVVSRQRASDGDYEVQLRWRDLVFDTNEIGSLFGTNIGRLIAGDDPFAQIVGGAVGASIVENFAEFAEAVSSSVFAVGLDTPFEQITKSSLGDIVNDSVENVQAASLDALSSLIIAEAAEAIGADGFAGRVFTIAGDTVADQIASNIKSAIDQSKVIDSTVIFENFDSLELVSSFGTALGSYVGGEIADDVIEIDSIAEAISTSVVGTYVGIQGGAIGAAVAGVTGTTGSIATAVSGTIVGELAGTYLGALLLPGVGALIGTVFGQAIGSAIFEFFDGVTNGWFTDLFSPDPLHYVYVTFNEDGSELVFHSDGSKDTTADLRQATYSLNDAYMEAVNDVIDDIGGKVDTSVFSDVHSHAYFGYVHAGNVFGDDDFKVSLGGGPNYVNANGDLAKLIRTGVEYELLKLRFLDGNQVKVRAFEKWQDSVASPATGDGLHSLAKYMQVAEDYGRYLESAPAINALIVSNPNTPFAVQWVSALMQAEAMGLHQPYNVGYDTSADGTCTFRNDFIVTADGNDQVCGGSGSDVIRTHGGDDTVNGGFDDDNIDSGAGNDNVWADTGADHVTAGDGDDVVSGGPGPDALDGGTGIDVLTYSGANTAIHTSLLVGKGFSGEASGDQISNFENLVGTGLGDHLEGNDLANSIYGGQGPDLIEGHAGVDTLFGEGGDDVIRGGRDADRVFGGVGNDQISGGDGDDELAGEGGNDTINGGSGNDRLIGNHPGGVGQDTLIGGPGDDQLEGGSMADSLDGGEGDDTVYAGPGDDTVNGGSGDDQLLGDDGADNIDAGPGADVVFGGKDGDVISGGLGRDLLGGDDGNDTIDGGEDDDEIFGANGDDLLIGGSGNDEIGGEDGHDEIHGNDGDDSIYADGPGWAGNDIVFAGEGNDLVRAGRGEDVIHGGPGNDFIFGEEGRDNIFGNEGEDFINSGEGDDIVNGGADADTILSHAGKDTVQGGPGDDLIFTLGDNDVADGGLGADRIFGDEGRDTLRGSDGDDYVDGGNQNDNVFGGRGNDVVIGGGGDDRVLGDDGDDVVHGDWIPNPNALPNNEQDILSKIQVKPNFSTWGLLYQGEGYTLEGIRNANHEMVVINPAKNSITNAPSSEEFWSPREIELIRNSGKTVFGYVNLAKMGSYLDEWNPTWTDNGIAGGVATSEAPDWIGTVESSSTRLIDFAAEGWHEVVFGRTEQMIRQGFDGTLLDDVLEYYFRVPLEPGTNGFNAAIAETASVMRDFVISLREYADTRMIAHGRNERFQLIVNGAPYILTDAIRSLDIDSNPQSQRYLDAIDAILIENYISRGDQFTVDTTRERFLEEGIPVLSIDTEQVTQQQKVNVITQAVNQGIVPYVTETANYDRLNEDFLTVLAAPGPVCGDDVLDGGAGSNLLIGGCGSDTFVISTSSETTIDDIGPNEMIDLTAFEVSFDQLRKVQSGSDTHVSLPNGSTITILNANVNELDARRFIGLVGGNPILGNGDSELSDNDIDILSEAVRTDLQRPEFDLNEDDEVDEEDLQHWVQRRIPVTLT